MNARIGWTAACRSIFGLLVGIALCGCGDSKRNGSAPDSGSARPAANAAGDAGAPDPAGDSNANAASPENSTPSNASTASDGATEAPAGVPPDATPDATSDERSPKTTRPPVKPNPLRSGAGANDAAAGEGSPGGKPAGEKPPGEASAKPAGEKPSKSGGAGTARVALFEGWPKPDAVLVLTGRQNGYIEPCGCAGLANQKGGLARRASFLKQMQDDGWPVVAFDLGNQVKRFGRQSEIKFQMAVEGLRQMDYQAIGLGPDDLRLSATELFAIASEEPKRFVSANVTVIDREATPGWKTVEAGGLKLGVVAVLADEYADRVKNDEVQVRPAAEALAEAAAELAKAECDWQVLLVYGSIDDTRKLAKQFPQFQIAATAGGAEEPAFEPEVLADSGARIVQVGAKGMYAGAIGLYRDGETRLRYQRVPLDARYADSPEMLRLLAAYQDQLQEAGLEGLGLRQLAHPSGRSFTGSEKCGECHTKAMAKWLETGHGKATETLVHPEERSEVPRHYDPECLSCHVTGWEPQKMFPYKSGYLGLKETPHLTASGCENCHGPGSAHVAAESGEGAPSASLVAQLRKEMQLPLAQAQQKCIECHDHDNSPEFHHDKAFDEYWKRIEHPGKD